MLDLNPFDAIAHFALGLLNRKVIQGWAKLLFEMTFSAVASFLFMCGFFLLTTQNWAIAIGSGLTSASLALAFLFRRSPLTKGMLVVLPGEEAKAEIDANLQTIQK